MVGRSIPGNSCCGTHKQLSLRRPPVTIHLRQRNQVQQQRCRAHKGLTERDLQLLRRAAEVADGSAGLAQPHPNSGCVLTGKDGTIIQESFRQAEGTPSAEALAVHAVKDGARGATAYLNLEAGDCHGDDASVKALIQGGVERVVIGIRHPLSHMRSCAIGHLRAANIQVDVLGEAHCHSSDTDQRTTLEHCLQANEALLHRAQFHRPFGILKYAMTLDGKIATSSGHAAWISSPASRKLVFDTRARSHAVIVGGNTVRRDNPRLTTRREGGHQPTRVVMTQKLDLPEDANLWDISTAPTLVITQRGARATFQQRLRDRGVEVIELDFLTPDKVAQYCYRRGFLQVLWECGGVLAAPAIADAAIHKVMAFIAPKLVGGVLAPTPVGELGNVEMTQALQLLETRWQTVGPDVLLTGFLPAAGGLWGIHDSNKRYADIALPVSQRPAGQPSATAGTASSIVDNISDAAPQVSSSALRRPDQVAYFYKSWDRYGVFSNFTPHCISVPADHESQEDRCWSTVEHYYQAHKFTSAAASDPEAAALVQAIRTACAPEQAAALGRRAEREQPHLLHPDWGAVKLTVMLDAVRAKFTQHPAPRTALLATMEGDHGPLQLVEDSPNDSFWGDGPDGCGANHLGRILERVRAELVAADAQAKQYVSVSSEPPRPSSIDMYVR